jgi:hypothetical protein
LIAFFSALVATANILVLTGTAGVCLVLRLGLVGLRRTLPAGVLTATGAAIALALPIAWNATQYGVASLNPAGGALLFAKLADAGLAQRYLDEACPRIQYPVCAARDRLRVIDKPQAFLWEGDPSPADEFQAWNDSQGYFARIARRTIRAYPRDFVGLVGGDMVQLLGRPTLGFAIEGSDELKPDPLVRPALAAHHPDSIAAYERSRQQVGTLAPLYPASAYVLLTVAGYGALIAGLGLAVARHDWETAAVLAALGAAILGGLAVHGGLVGPFARYHVKLSWLAAFGVAVALLAARVAAGHDRPAS